MRLAEGGYELASVGRQPVAMRWAEAARFLDRLRLLSGWESFLQRLGISDEDAHRAAGRASANRTSLHAEVLVAGHTAEEHHFRALADDLQLPFVQRVDPDRLLIADAHMTAALGREGGNSMAMVESGGGEASLVLAPSRLDVPAMKTLLAGNPPIARRLSIAAPSVLRAALLRRARDRLIQDATGGLFASMPDMSARQPFNGWQGLMVGVGIAAAPVALWAFPHATLLTTYLFLSLVFLCCVGLRLAAALTASPLEPPSIPRTHAAHLPIYSVLVALYREADVVPDLLDALGKLVWPRSKLEVKIVCEEDDHETLRELARHPLRPWIEVIRVPKCEPRTKPKALCYALPMVSGDFVALYDAEDRPHPAQLLEAWNRFRVRDDRLACVQAPLDIANGAFGFLPRMFRVEYAALFCGVLPWLASRGLLFPLGGTSNHFRRNALVETGGWDPHNVTEDADLGVRLARFGYRCETIFAPTLEDAPEDARVWIKQRTRWFKGWAQTWFVHMRNPWRLYREIGPGSFMVVQIMFAGMLASSLAHPWLWVTLGGLAARFAIVGALTPQETALLVLAALNIVSGYGSFLFLAWRSLPPSERSGYWKVALFTVPYWMLMSAAAYRAIWEFVRRPHHWEKTPHTRFRRLEKRAPATETVGSIQEGAST